MTKLETVLRHAKVALLLLIAIQLTGIWLDLRTIKREQLKNMLAVLPQQTVNKLNDDGVRKLQSTVWNVRTVNSVDGTVQVEISSQPMEVEVVR